MADWVLQFLDGSDHSSVLNHLLDQSAIPKMESLLSDGSQVEDCVSGRTGVSDCPAYQIVESGESAVTSCLPQVNLSQRALLMFNLDPTL